MNRKDAFKKVIRLVPADQPDGNFTDKLMSEIHADLEREEVLKALLQRQVVEGPSFSFTANVMSQLNAQNKRLVSKPIITKRAWLVIAAVLAVLILLIGLVNASTPHPPTSQSIVANAISYIRQIPLLYLIVLPLTAVLLMVDLLFNKLFKKIAAA